MFCIYFSFPTKPFPAVASEPHFLSSLADLGKRIDGPRLGRQSNLTRGGLCLSCPSWCRVRRPARPLALHTRSSPAAAEETGRRREDMREGVPSVLCRRVLLRCNTTNESPQGRWARHKISRNSGCAGALSGFDQAFQPSPSLFGLSLLPCIPTLSSFLFFPSSIPANNGSNHPPPPRIASCRPSVFRVRVRATTTGLYCIASSSHTGTGTGTGIDTTRNRPDDETVSRPGLSLSGISHPIIGVSSDDG
ncbi:hypothetical protein B0T18DRAFT_192899 [Schizothecium vesticola]|uniref:Uncharacterized protein n=1 Tax=Schizothecium vesticola TaxID=314040 RepID=A0AA40ER00_9PEZI|nr:hypothetical protein B0T18DRAFT_192899 [Schizothecium vesticola]